MNALDKNDVLDYPEHDIDPEEKDASWVLKNAKAKWSEAKMYSPIDMFWFGRTKYEEIAQYVMGKQTTDKYKRRLLPEDQQDASWLNIDWSIRPIMTTYIEKCIAKLLQRDFNIVFTAVNEQAKNDQDDYYNKMKVRILTREALKQSNPQLLNNPAVQIQPGEPQDLEELDMYMQYGYKHAMSIQAELATDLVFSQNDIRKQRKKNVESLVYYGLGGFKEGVTHTGRVKLRPVNVDRVVMSYCEENDFSDATFIGEVVEKTFGEISPYFSKTELEEIKKVAAGQWGNPGISDLSWEYNYHRHKVWVWDMEFLSYNDSNWECRNDKRGNPQFGKISYKANPEERIKNAVAKGQQPAEYKRDTTEVVYRTCWIVDSDFQYNAGLATNMKRTNGEPYQTSLSYHLNAWNFRRMRFGGIAERLIPLQDEYQETVYKIQNFKNKWIPYIMKIDIAALEKTAVAGKAGKNMKPLELLDFLFQNHILLVREDNLNPGNPNYKPMDLQMTEMAENFKVLFDDLMRIVGEMEKVAGFNAVSAGGNVDPRMLAPGYNAALAGTMDSLYLATESEKHLLEKLATGVIQRLQVAIQMGPVSGYIQSLGAQGLKFFNLSKDISLYDFGIFAEDRPDAAQRAQFIEKLKVDEQNGLILPQDLIMIENIKNLKQAEILLAFRIDRRKKENQSNAIQQQQLAQQGSQQSAQQAMVAKQQELSLTLENDMKKINAEMQWQYIIQKMKTDGSLTEAQLHSQSKIIAQQIIEDSKQKLLQ